MESGETDNEEGGAKEGYLSGCWAERVTHLYLRPGHLFPTLFYTFLSSTLALFFFFPTCLVHQQK